MRPTYQKLLIVSLTVFCLVWLLIEGQQASAATLQLSWADNSSDESGFSIERKLEVGGIFAVVNKTAANVTAYSDPGLADNTTYCYRVNAFNNSGSSAYTSETCVTTPPLPTIYNLSISAGSGGTVTSSPNGIDCGTTCTANFASGTTITLQPNPLSGYSFAGWSGDGDCSDGSVTMTANKSCTANFSAIPNVSYSLTVVIGLGSGAGTGTVVSSPTGIDCGSKCSATFQSGATVTLQANPASGSSFSGWSGDSDCSDGSVTMNTNKSCTASFKLSASSYSLTVMKTGDGTGKVTSNVAGIDCGTNCVAQFGQGTVVALTATAGSDSVFAGWSGDPDCLDGQVTVSANKSCSAGFTRDSTPNLTAKVGVYRPTSGAWYLFTDSTGQWQGCTTDICAGPFGGPNDLPLVGDWTGAGQLRLGFYDTTQKSWELDVNGDLNWNGCSLDRCFDFAVSRTVSDEETPLVGSWTGAAKYSAGVYKLVSTTKKRGKTKVTSIDGYWYFDRNGNGKWDGCNVDLCYGPFGQADDLPVVGDWTGSGAMRIGVFNPQTGMWKLDANGNGKADSCTLDRCYGPFGAPGDLPITGDWDGGGTAKIGIFRATTGEWFLDLNGNGIWDGPTVDKYIKGFGQSGDLPIAGKW